MITAERVYTGHNNVTTTRTLPLGAQLATSVETRLMTKSRGATMTHRDNGVGAPSAHVVRIIISSTVAIQHVEMMLELYSVYMNITL